MVVEGNSGDRVDGIGDDKEGVEYAILCTMFATLCADFGFVHAAANRFEMVRHGHRINFQRRGIRLF